MRVNLNLKVPSVKLIKVACLFLLLLTLAGCNLVNLIKMRYANDDLEPVWTGQNTSTSLTAFYHEEDKPFVEVTLNGIEGFKFMVDTGASMSYVIDTEKVKALGLIQGYSLSVSGWGDEESSTLFQTQVDSLALSDVSFAKVNLAFLHASKTNYFLRQEEATFDGVLGHDILHHFSWRFDKENNQIAISSKPFVPHGAENAIPFEVFFSKISVPTEVNFGPDAKGNAQVFSQDVLVDTGSRHYAKMSAAYVNNHIEHDLRSITAADFGLSGKTEHQRISLPELTLGSQSFTQVKTNLIGPDDDEDDNWVIGSGLLNQFTTVIDYHSGVMYLYQQTPKAYQSDYNLLGLELRKLTSGEFVVRYVLPDMAAAQADFQEGDLIESVNGVPAHNIQLVDWLAMSAQPGEYQICRKRQATRCLTLESEHIKDYSVL